MELSEYICTPENITFYIDSIIENFNLRNLIFFLENFKTASFSNEHGYSKLLSNITNQIDILNTNTNQHTITHFDWNFKFENIEPDITFCESGILWPQGIGLLTGPAGKGKTNIMLAACSSLCNQDADTIGLKINNFPAIYVDTENQSSIFHRNVFRALVNRAKLPLNSEHDKISFVSIRSLETYEEKQNWLFHQIRSKKYRVFLLDGVGDMVLDVNDTPSCIPFVSKLCAYTFTYNCSIILTLHGNPLANAEKARGVLGSELLRKADSNILLQVKNDNRCITTEFSLGKNRGSRDTLTQYFEWDPIQEMHVSCTEIPSDETSISKQHYSKIADVMEDKLYKPMELTKLIQSTLNVSLSTAKRKQNEMKKNGMIDKIENDYRLSPEELLKFYASQSQ
jgi:hypothetical protein